MKQKIAFFILTLLCIGCTKDPQIQAAYDLIERVTPGYGQQFKLELIEPVNGEDAYEIASTDGKYFFGVTTPFPWQRLTINI